MHNNEYICDLQAMDGDAEPPNNEVRYEIISGNFANKFELDPMTGAVNLFLPVECFLLNIGLCEKVN
jgi:hypothetical protein